MTQEELDRIWNRGETHHRREPEDKTFRVRNVLNILVMLAVVVGIALYMYTPMELFGYPLWGLVVGLAIIIKTIEVSLRMIFK